MQFRLLILVINTVSNARLFLVILIVLSPGALVSDGPIMHGVVAGVAAIGLAMIARTMRPGETAYFLTFARPWAVLAAVPATWMLLQVLPIGAFAHPIWTSAAAAIGKPITGAISIDIGESVLALGQYLTIVAIAFWSAAVAVDRLRAEWILFALTAATTLIGLVGAVEDRFGLTFKSAGEAQFMKMQSTDCVAMGVIIAAAAGIRTLERYETRHANPDRSVWVLRMTLAACGTAFAVCLMAVLFCAPSSTFVATPYGVTTLMALVCIRRFGFGRWGTTAIVLSAILLTVFLVASELSPTKSSVLAFADQTPAALSLSQRILDDVPWAGTGAGTFAAIAQIYRSVDDHAVLFTGPTTAAVVVVELGRPMLWLMVATTAGAIFILLRASLRRGRDSFYPMAGAGCLITLLFLCFTNAGALGTTAAIIAAATLGLALAQSKSRTTQQ